MSDFDPLVLLFVARESLGQLFWPLLAGAALLFLAVLAAGLRAWRRHALGRPLRHAALAGLFVAVAATFAVPAWTLVGLDALNGVVDIAAAFLFGLIPGVVAAALVFVACTLRRTA